VRGGGPEQWAPGQDRGLEPKARDSARRQTAAGTQNLEWECRGGGKQPMNPKEKQGRSRARRSKPKNRRTGREGEAGQRERPKHGSWKGRDGGTPKYGSGGGKESGDEAPERAGRSGEVCGPERKRRNERKGMAKRAEAGARRGEQLKRAEPVERTCECGGSGVKRGGKDKGESRGMKQADPTVSGASSQEGGQHSQGEVSRKKAGKRRRRDVKRPAKRGRA